MCTKIYCGAKAENIEKDASNISAVGDASVFFLGSFPLLYQYSAVSVCLCLV